VALNGSSQPLGLANETTMDLEQTIGALVCRKKKLDLDSPERQLINRILTGLLLIRGRWRH
jgi:hypothetical protein